MQHIANDLQPSPGLVGYLSTFRGFAILNSVVVHSWALPLNLSGGTHGTFALRFPGTAANVQFHHSTWHFALISGFLFSLVLQHRRKELDDLAKRRGRESATASLLGQLSGSKWASATELLKPPNCENEIGNDNAITM